MMKALGMLLLVMVPTVRPGTGGAAKVVAFSSTLQADWAPSAARAAPEK